MIFAPLLFYIPQSSLLFVPPFIAILLLLLANTTGEGGLDYAPSQDWTINPDFPLEFKTRKKEKEKVRSWRNFGQIPCC